MGDDTIFDKIVRKETKADIVYEDETVLAFKDVNPQAPIHVLVVPKTKIAGLDMVTELPVAEAGAYIQAVAKVAERLGLEGGYRVVFNIGSHGQQSVRYLHAHILGGRQMTWPPG